MSFCRGSLNIIILISHCQLKQSMFVITVIWVDAISVICRNHRLDEGCSINYKLSLSDDINTLFNQNEEEKYEARFWLM